MTRVDGETSQDSGILAWLRPTRATSLGRIGSHRELVEFGLKASAKKASYRPLFRALQPQLPAGTSRKEDKQARGPRFVTVSQASDYTGLSESTIRRMLRTGRLSGSKVSGKWFIDWEEILALLEAEDADASARPTVDREEENRNT